MYKVTYKGITYRSLQLACDRLSIHPNTVRQQYKYIPFDQAIEQILKNKKRNSCTDHLGNEFESIRTMAEFYHIPYNTLYNRLKRKWSLKKALITPNGKSRGKYAKSKVQVDIPKSYRFIPDNYTDIPHIYTVCGIFLLEIHSNFAPTL